MVRVWWGGLVVGCVTCCGEGCGVLSRRWLCLGGCWVGAVGLWIIRCRRCLLIVLMTCGFWACRWAGLGLGLPGAGRVGGVVAPGGLGSRVLYPGVFPDTDLVFDVTEVGVDEFFEV